MSVVDQKSRERALDPSASFIVQAPAGSGKTGLLTQRFLVLLAGVDAPEEIVAITFTRKAAGEMRQRILDALASAQHDPAPEKDHERQTWELARQALSRDQEKDWQLLNNPARLRIQTIDSFCATLARQMPVLSQFGSIPATTEDAEPLYLQAAGNAIAEMESRETWSDAVAHLVQHMDNQLNKLQGLIATMLAKRDQWLRHVADPNHPRLERENLEIVLTRLVIDSLNELAACKPVAQDAELFELIRFAANNLQGSDSPIASCTDLREWPGTQVSDRQQWEGIMELLLTKTEGTWRKSVRKTEGFPAQTATKDKEEKAHFADMKQRMKDLLGTMEGEDDFREKLHAFRTLPSHEYTEDEWETLCALVELLRIAAAHLRLVFGQHRQVDFPALSQAAIQALGEEESPTDLALALDYRIRHLLVDEFQDSSFNQYELLKRLTAGWQPEDGHTLFVVGDPMQSIYLFREAQVGMFLAAREHGIGQVPLEFLRLEVNFRSQQGIVDWINQHFPEVLPIDNDVVTGAVSYASSTAFHPPLEGESVFVYPSLERDDDTEAQQVVSIVEKVQSENPEGTSAILVRNRPHLEAIIESLQEAGIRFQAVEIERLAHRQVIQDLLALTRALSHVGDRIAWLAVLRAPYCGLTLDDLYLLAGDDRDKTVIECLHQEERLSKLSKDGQCRLARVLPILDAAFSEQARSSLRDYIEGAWIEMGGPACVEDETDLEDGEVYFQLLEKIGSTGGAPNIEELNRQVNKMFALPDVEADGSLQVMTIYKAKGLEFDTVIVPGLGRPPRHDDKKLLHWLEFGLESGGSDLLLAPISGEGLDNNLSKLTCKK